MCCNGNPAQLILTIDSISVCDRFAPFQLWLRVLFLPYPLSSSSLVPIPKLSGPMHYR
jgi:hypothetical protein